MINLTHAVEITLLKSLRPFESALIKQSSLVQSLRPFENLNIEVELLANIQVAHEMMCSELKVAIIHQSSELRLFASINYQK